MIGGRRTGCAAIETLVAGVRAQLLRRHHAKAIGEILLLGVDLLAQFLDLMRQFFGGARGIGEALGERPHLVLKLLNAARQLADLRILAVFVRLAGGFFFVAFAEKLGIKYPLLADFHPKGAVAAQYGLFLEDKGIAARATVVVDKGGKVADVKVQDIPQARNNADILAVLKDLG